MPAYENLYARLVARCQDGDGPCWVGIDRSGTRGGYQQIDVWIPGLKDPAKPENVRGRRKLYAHVALWCWIKWDCKTADELWLAYQELRASGLELDHECEEPACRNPAHLVPRTHLENVRASRERRNARIMARPLDE